VGLAVAPFLSLEIAVKVINEVSMWTLVVAGLAGLDATRPDAPLEPSQPVTGPPDAPQPPS
jgi:hypothetical protein